VVAHRSARLVEFLERVLELGECLVVVELALDKADALGELLPDVLVEWRAGILLDRIMDHLCEVLVDPVPAGEPHESETGGKQAAVGEVIDRRHQFLSGEVTRYSKDDQGARPGDPVETAVGGQPQRVELRRDFHRGHSAPSEFVSIGRRADQTMALKSVARSCVGSVSVRVSTGRPWSASTLASPAACAWMR